MEKICHAIIFEGGTTETLTSEEILNKVISRFWYHFLLSFIFFANYILFSNDPPIENDKIKEFKKYENLYFCFVYFYLLF